jgi:hypothetical protein
MMWFHLSVRHSALSTSKKGSILTRCPKYFSAADIPEPSRDHRSSCGDLEIEKVSEGPTLSTHPSPTVDAVVRGAAPWFPIKWVHLAVMIQARPIALEDWPDTLGLQQLSFDEDKVQFPSGELGRAGEGPAEPLITLWMFLGKLTVSLSIKTSHPE